MRRVAYAAVAVDYLRQIGEPDSGRDDEELRVGPEDVVLMVDYQLFAVDLRPVFIGNRLPATSSPKLIAPESVPKRHTTWIFSAVSSSIPGTGITPTASAALKKAGQFAVEL